LSARRLALVAAFGLLLVGCGGGGEAVLSGEAVLTVIPWSAAETAHYRLLDGDDPKGTGTLRIEPQSSGVLLRQSFEIPDEGLSDDVSVEADGRTLTPRRVERTINGPEGKRTCVGDYSGSKVTVEQKAREDQRTDELDVPTRAYDSWSDLFLWRTIAFQEGYEASYPDVLTCTLVKPQILTVVLKLRRIEEVSVPAGTFQAWRLEIRSGGRTQKAWYSDDASHTLVRYDNGDLVFELESLE